MKISAAILLALAVTMAYAQNHTKVDVSDKCLQCICQANSGMKSCKKNSSCAGDLCGPFGITEGYWEDGGKNTIGGKSSNSTDAYESCAKDMQCSKRTVKGYMNRYAKDCNKDNNVDCVDFASIHRLGPIGCTVGKLPDSFQKLLNDCLQ